MRFIGTNGLFNDKFKSSREKSDKEKTNDRRMCQCVKFQNEKENVSQASFKVCVLFAVSVVAAEKKLGPRLGINFLQVEEKVKCTKQL